MRKSAESLSVHSNALWKLMVVALGTVLMSGTLFAQNQIATGKKITPAGFNGEIASLPMNDFTTASDYGIHVSLSGNWSRLGATSSKRWPIVSCQKTRR
jgi:hypothetical protein